MGLQNNEKKKVQSSFDSCSKVGVGVGGKGRGRGSHREQAGGRQAGKMLTKRWDSQNGQGQPQQQRPLPQAERPLSGKPSFLGWGSRAGRHGPKMDRCKGSVPWPDSVSQIQVRAFPISACALAIYGMRAFPISACALARLGCVPFPFSAHALASFGQRFPVLGDPHPLTSLGQNWAKSSSFGRR